MSEKRWTIVPPMPEQATKLQQALSINPIVCNILAQRGHTSYELCKDFFRPQLSQLHDPYLMKDMDKAVNRIADAIAHQEKILVFGDYDVDGTTAVALAYQFLCKIYKPAFLEYYIPHRYREGYGVSKAGIDFAFENNFKLIVSLDCGIKSVELIAYAKGLGIDFIVCDHHQPDETLPEAVAILNPKQSDCQYPFKDLCGCGVGFKLITALAQNFNVSDNELFYFLDLVAIAIAADIVPMTGENRILAYHGMERINKKASPGIQAIIDLENIKHTLTIQNVVFIIAPRINAAGRMDDARKAVELFIEQNKEKTTALAKLLQEDNTDRKEADTTTTQEALAILEKDSLNHTKKTSVVYKEDWHKGVVGIVASRLIEKHYRPTVVLTRSNNIISGSARSIVGFNLYEAIHACREHLLLFGGHFAAAGLSLLPEKLADFSSAFESVVSKSLPDELLTPEVMVDAEIKVEDIKWPLYNILHQMEPFGPGNMRPLFLSKRLIDTGYSKIVKEKHVRFVLQENDQTITGIGFGLAEKFHLIESKKPVDVVYSIDENDYKGNKSLQIRVIDLKPSEATD